MKIGVNIKVDVTKLDKSRFYVGEKGTYADLVVFIDTENTSQYGDHGVITQSKNKDEDIKLPILGNAKIFWRARTKMKISSYRSSEMQRFFGERIMLRSRKNRKRRRLVVMMQGIKSPSKKRR
jgi:hypothetical protein